MRGLIVQPMLVFIYISSLCGALVHCRTLTSQPSVESMTFQAQAVDHTSEFSIPGTTHFSVEQQAYKVEIGGTSLFIYQNENEGSLDFYYYYPSSDFTTNNFNITKCISHSVQGSLSQLSLLPSLEGFVDLGTDNVFDTPAEKYKKSTYKIGFWHQKVIWVEKHDNKTGINNRPIRMAQKKGRVLLGVKADLIKHMVTEYFGFSVGEQPPSVWERPDVHCEETDDVVMPVDVATDAGFIFSNAATNTMHRYATGRRMVSGVNEIRDPKGFTPDFPYTRKQYKKLAKHLPKSFDWRDYGAVTEVKNQRNCGSCWAFGSVGSLEGAYFMKTHELIELSEQALVDCAGSPHGSDGCFGGWEPDSFKWINKTGGIPPAEEYIPYQDINGHCQVNNNTKLVAQVKGYYKIPSSVHAVKVALTKFGPLVVSIDASPIMSYKSGVVSGDACSNRQINHSVLLVGYGESSEDGPYWIIKNSWSTNWGMDGYFLLSAKGNCLRILDEVFFPILK